MGLQFRIEDTKGPMQTLMMKGSPTLLKIELSSDVLFGFDKAEVRPEAEPALYRFVDIVTQYPGTSIVIEGYTDSKGTESHDLELSNRRAASIKSWLIEKGGMEGARIKTKGWGKANPKAPNENVDGSDNPEGRRMNRRIQITVNK
jgi:outer membrane protein OmpA-like peptidoglycan-associated protein